MGGGRPRPAAALTVRFVGVATPRQPGDARAAEREPSGTSRKSIIRRVVTYALAGVSFYIVLPSLLATFGELPGLRGIGWWFFPLLFAFEAASFWCLWVVQRLALGVRRVFDVACSQLAGNAVSRALPGGAAAGGVLQYRMLVQVGLDPATVTTALTAVGLLDMATLFSLPVLALPSIVTGQLSQPPLVLGAIIGAVLFVLLGAVGAVALGSDGAVRWVARTAATVLKRIRKRRHIEPDVVAERTLASRNLVRRTLGSSWRRAVPAAYGNALFDVAALQAAIFATGAGFHPSLTLLAYVAANVLAMIPLTPGGVGFVEAGLTGMLTLIGATGAQAVLATLLYRLFSYWLPMLAGAVAWALFKRRHPGVADATTAKGLGIS